MHPIIFQTKFFILHTYWIFFLIGILFATYLFIKLSLKNRLKLQFISENSWKFIFSALILGRLVAVIENFNIYFYEFNGNTLINLLKIWDRGISIWGVILGLVLYLYFLCRKNEQEFWRWMDVLVPSLISFMAITHIGAFFEGINYGNETSLPWGVNFENYAIKYAVPIHPTQFYAFLYSAGLAYFLTHTSKTFEKPGLGALLGTTLYSFFYFLEQFVRGDDVWVIAGIRLPQIIALIILLISSVMLYKHYKVNK